MRRTPVFVLVCLVLVGSGAAYAAAPNDPGWSMQWHMRTIRADQAWARSRGSGIVVAVVDTGVDLSHPDLRARITTGIDLVNPGTSAQDEQGHGTFMAGLIAATSGNSTGVAGVALLLAYEQSLVSEHDLSQVKRAFDLNGYVGILYLLSTAAAIYVR
jgi:subtilisin family serine protease